MCTLRMGKGEAVLVTPLLWLSGIPMGQIREVSPIKDGGPMNVHQSAGRWYLKLIKYKKQRSSIERALIR